MEKGEECVRDHIVDAGSFMRLLSLWFLYAHEGFVDVELGVHGTESLKMLDASNLSRLAKGNFTAGVEVFPEKARY